MVLSFRDLTQRIHDRIPLIEWHRDALPFEFRACVVLEMRGELREERRGEHASVTHRCRRARVWT